MMVFLDDILLTQSMEYLMSLSNARLHMILDAMDDAAQTFAKDEALDLVVEMLHAKTWILTKVLEDAGVLYARTGHTDT